MIKSSLSNILIIGGFVAGMATLPSLADVLTPPALNTDSPPVAHSTMRSLGTIETSDMNNEISAPQPVQAGDVTYVTGGIGDDERSALDAAKANYNLHILSASKSGAYIGDTHITLQDRRGAQILDVSSGPILLVNLPKGNYTLAASSEGQSRTEQVKVDQSKPTNVRLDWN